MNRHRSLPYSKVCDLLGDAELLAGPLRQIEACPAALEGQHPIRRWEYAMALHAINGWAQWYWSVNPTSTDRDAPRRICDIGGAGSGFWQLLAGQTSEPIVVIDPSIQPAPDLRGRLGYAGTVEQFAAEEPHDQFDVVTCISVIEHVPAPRAFLRAARMLLKPGGLLFLTTDYWDAEGPDVAHYHWMRQRIYNAGRMTGLLEALREVGFRSFGTADWSYHGPQVFDYSVAAAALTKKGTR